MPNIKSAKKRVAVISKKTAINTVIKTATKTAIKKFENEPSEENLKNAFKAIDRAWNKGILKKNTASRKKARLSKMISK